MNHKTLPITSWSRREVDRLWDGGPKLDYEWAEKIGRALCLQSEEVAMNKPWAKKMKKLRVSFATLSLSKPQSEETQAKE
jgi:hypothetical protein